LVPLDVTRTPNLGTIASIKSYRLLAGAGFSAMIVRLFRERLATIKVSGATSGQQNSGHPVFSMYSHDTTAHDNAMFSIASETQAPTVMRHD
jgi:hypothetical protein